MSQKIIELMESVSGIGADCIDREAGVIRGVKIVGCKSRNGKTYSIEVLEEAIPLYEGVSVYLGHNRPLPNGVKKERSTDDFWGSLRNVRSGKDGLYGDLEYLKSHEKTAKLLESAKRFPKHFGMSHDALGIEGYGGYVSKITKVNSVDVVCKPATTSGLFESEESKKMIVKDLIGSLGSTHREAFVALFESDPFLGEVSVPEVSVDESAADQIKSAFRTSIDMVIDEDIEAGEKMAKIKGLVKAMDQAYLAVKEALEAKSEKKEENDPKEDEGSGSEVEGEFKESEEDMARLQELETRLLESQNELEQEKDRNSIIIALMESKVEATPVRIKSLMGLNADERKELIDSFKTPAKADPSLRPPNSKSRLFESESGGITHYPKSKDEISKLLR